MALDMGNLEFRWRPYVLCHSHWAFPEQLPEQLGDQNHHMINNDESNTHVSCYEVHAGSLVTVVRWIVSHLLAIP